MVVACTVNRNIMRAVRGERYRLEPRAQKKGKSSCGSGCVGCPCCNSCNGRDAELKKLEEVRNKNNNESSL